jgi:hypothetical protein
MSGGRAGLTGEVEADSEVGQFGRVEIDGVAEEDNAGADGGAGFAVERKGAIGALHDGGLLGPERDVGGAKSDRRTPEGVREANAQPLAGDAGADHHPDGLVVVSARRIGVGIGGRGRRCPRQRFGGGPSGYPMVVGRQERRREHEGDQNSERDLHRSQL